MHCQSFRDLLGNFKSARPDFDLWDQAGCQGIVRSVPCCVQLFCTALCAPHPLPGRACSQVGICLLWSMFISSVCSCVFYWLCSTLTLEKGILQ